MAEVRAENNSPAGCVLLHPRGHEPDGELLAALARREIQPLACNSAFVAFAELFRLRKLDAARSGRALVLLLVEPDGLDHPEELVHAVERHGLRAACWMYQPGPEPRLRAVTQEDVERWSSQNAPTIATRLVARPPARTADVPDSLQREGLRPTATLRLSDNSALSGVTRASESSYQKSNGAHAPLSGDELAMLLAAEPGVDHH
jgi:hypothetical protein